VLITFDRLFGTFTRSAPIACRYGLVTPLNPTIALDRLHDGGVARDIWQATSWRARFMQCRPAGWCADGSGARRRTCAAVSPAQRVIRIRQRSTHRAAEAHTHGGSLDREAIRPLFPLA